MAAGLGTRLRPFTFLRTKALIPIMGVPVAQFAVDSLVSCGVTKIIANVHHNSGSAQKGLHQLEMGPANLQISDESSLLLGSAGGIRKALHHLGSSPFFLANADVICDVDWIALAAQHERLRAQRGVILTLAVFSFGPEGELYNKILYDSRCELITGLGGLQKDSPLYVGAAVFEPEAFTPLPLGEPSDFIAKILLPAIQDKKAGLFLTSGSYFDTGTPSLWHDTHMKLIKRLETEDFNTPISKLWKERIEKENRHFRKEIWISKQAPDSPVFENWNGPCYWNPDGYYADRIPHYLGPRSVLYGIGMSQNSFDHGIGMGEHWISCTHS